MMTYMEFFNFCLVIIGVITLTIKVMSKKN